MDNTYITMNIVAIILSPLIASLITIYLTNKYNKKKDKIEILKKLMITRLNNSTMDYVYALNLIDIIFYDSDDVRNEYKKLLKEYNTNNPDLNEIYTRKLKLIEAILNNIGYNKINWEAISKPYAPNWYYDELKKQEQYKDAQLLFADIIKKFNKFSQEDNNGNK